MRVVSYGKTFVPKIDVDTELTIGQLGICYSDGTVLDTEHLKDRPESFVVMSTIPDKRGGVAIQHGIDINPYNFHYEVRKYDDVDTKAKIEIKGITNPALKAPAGVVYPADASFTGCIEITSSQPYRVGLVENPHPQIVTIPFTINAIDSIAQIEEKIKKVIFLTTYNKDLFDIKVEKDSNGVNITVEAIKETRLTVNVFGIVKEQEINGVVTIKKIDLAGFLDCVADSDEDYRYSAINYGWNPHDEWQKAWGLGDPKAGLSKVAYVVISTAEFNQFPEIAADRNSPRKIQIVVMPKENIDTFVDALVKIKEQVSASHDNGIEVNTSAD